MAAKNKNEKLPYRLRVKVSRSIDEMEDWLATYCEGQYAYEFDGIQETGTTFNQLEILFKFAFDTDRQKFKSAIKSGKI